MIITFIGLQTFKIQFGDTVLAVNPASKNSSFFKQPSKFGADITLVSADHADFNGVENTVNKNKKAFIIEGPGDYEVNGVTISGFSSLTNYDGCRINTLYRVGLESMDLCFLGALSESGLTAEVFEKIEGADIVFVPIAGDGLLDFAESYKLSIKLEAKIVIPCHFLDVKEDCVSDFFKEGSEERFIPLDKYTVKKRDIEDKKAEIKILKPSK